jgi:F-type H+-transporting ATPase subunit delta
MPRRATAAKRYAEAIAGLARDAGSWERWRQDLHAVGEAAQAPALRDALASPNLPSEVKQGLLARALGERAAPETRNLLSVMARRNRLDLLPDVVAWFDELADLALGIERVTVTTAAPLTDGQRRRLRERLAKPGGAVVLAEQVDPDILGGLVVRQGDVIRDYSVRARLESLRERLN